MTQGLHALSAASSPGRQRQRLLAAFVLLLIGEALLFALLFNGLFVPLRRSADLAGLAGYFPQIARLVLYAAAGVLLLCAPSLGSYWRLVGSAAARWPLGRYALLHLACFGAIVGVAGWLTAAGSAPGPAAGLLCGLLLLLSAIFGATALLVAAPAQLLGQWLRAQWLPLLVILALSAGFQALLLTDFSLEGLMHGLLFTPTVTLAGGLLRLLGHSVVLDVATKSFGTPVFTAQIAPSCLGYQGASLVLLFLSVYLYVARRQFRFPQAALVIPLAAVGIWLLNALRVALLVLIGSSWSADIAVNGFHSAAGWINFLLASGCALWALHAGSWFSAAPGSARLGVVITDDNVLLLPQMALIAASLATLLLTGSFDWAYPLRVVVVAWVLYRCWPRLALGRWAPDPVAVAIGVAVFAVWLLLVPASAPASEKFSAELFSVTMALSLGWLLMRCVGAIVIVPLAEELAFRGFLLPWLAQRSGLPFGPRLNSLLALLLSSLAFGVLHGAWLAGTVAGLAFGLARLRRGRLLDAVVAHAVANALLAAYAIGWRQWSYW